MAIVPPPAYATYLYFAENLLLLALKTITLWTIGQLLFRLRFFAQTLRVQQLSPAMDAYLWMHFAGVFTSLPYTFYKLILWKWPPNRNPFQHGIYDPYTLFWLALPEMTYLMVTPFAIFFLTLDRICALRPTKLIGRYRHAISIFGIFVLFVVYIVLFAFFPIQELPLNVAQASLCEMAFCVMSNYRSTPQLGTKMCAGTANFVACIFFLWMLRKSSHIGKMNTKNRVVKFAIVCELFLDLLPTYCGFTFTLFAGYSGSIYAGDYIGIPMAIESAACGAYYLRVFRKKSSSSAATKKKITAVPVLPLNNNHKSVVPATVLTLNNQQQEEQRLMMRSQRPICSNKNQHHVVFVVGESGGGEKKKERGEGTTTSSSELEPDSLANNSSQQVDVFSKTISA